jgi:hypothetical protein
MCVCSFSIATLQPYRIDSLLRKNSVFPLKTQR